MEIFLSGLNDEKLIKALRAQNPTDLNEVISLVKSINFLNVNTSSNIAGVHKYDEKNSEINELKKHLTQLVFSLRKSVSEILGKNNNFPQKTYPDITNNRQYKFCSFCNMKNHSDIECFRKRKTNISNEIQCYNCNKRGHISRACPKRKRFNVIPWITRRLFTSVE